MSARAIHPKVRLAADLKAVIADTEELLKVTASQAGEKISAARARAEESLSAAKARLDEIEEAAVEKAKAAAKATDTYVHENPWQAIGIAAGVGFLVGLLVSRK
jgi:ElaB/YqjD/DUF883 family membrane-anchored ribosome-binding protein